MPSTPTRAHISLQMIVPGSVLYVSSLWSIKFALVLFYKKLAAPGSKMQIAYNFALAGLAVTFTTIFFDILFQCFPYDKRWSHDPACESINRILTTVSLTDEFQINVVRRHPESITGLPSYSISSLTSSSSAFPSPWS